MGVGMTTDIDRLHQVVQQPFHGERKGCTFAACHNVAGLIETIPFGATVVWILPRMNWVDHIKPMLAGVLEEHEIVPRKWLRYSVEFPDEKTLRFVLIDNLPEWGQGRRVFVVNDLGEAAGSMTWKQRQILWECRERWFDVNG